MSHRITRDRLTAAAVLVLALLVLAASVEAGQNLLAAALAAGTSYGMALVAAALVFALMKDPVGIRLEPTGSWDWRGSARWFCLPALGAPFIVWVPALACAADWHGPCAFIGSLCSALVA